MFFHTIACSCGWQFGPTSKKRAKAALAEHKRSHKRPRLPEGYAPTSTVDSPRGQGWPPWSNQHGRGENP